MFVDLLITIFNDLYLYFLIYESGEAGFSRFPTNHIYFPTDYIVAYPIKIIINL